MSEQESVHYNWRYYDPIRRRTITTRYKMDDDAAAKAMACGELPRDAVKLEQTGTVYGALGRASDPLRGLPAEVAGGAQSSSPLNSSPLQD